MESTAKRTPQEWWDSIKYNEVRLIEWLKAQYHGEATAAERILELAGRIAESGMSLRGMVHAGETLAVIAAQEQMHAKWIGVLLKSRGVEPELLEKSSRYWDETLPQIDTFEAGCAVATHAEAMRLERIRVICKDMDTPPDIRGVFVAILPQEEFHERAFRSLTTVDAMARVEPAHVRGLEALGLVL